MALMSRGFIFILAFLMASGFDQSVQGGEDSPCNKVAEGVLPAEKNLEQLTPESLLVSYLKIDTTNPPGCEGKAARFWKNFFDRYGVEATIIPLPFGHDRANILARVPGKKTGLRPILLLNHMDVVPAEASRWTVPPFSGVIRDGIIYGRGTFDMKATGVYQALMLARAKVQNWAMNRDLIFLGTSNEEGPFNPTLGVISGAEWMLKYRFSDLGNPEYVITEGGYIPTSQDKPIMWEVSPGEKARLEVTFSVDDKIRSQSDMFLVMAKSAKKIMDGFRGKSLPQTPMEKKRSVKDPVLHASLNTTHALTVLGGTGKGNTIPAEATARVFLRGLSQTSKRYDVLLKSFLPKNVELQSLEVRGTDLWITLKSKGEAGHASLPPPNGGANLMLLDAILALEQALGKGKLPAKQLQIENIAAASDLGPKDVRSFVIDFRLIPGDSRDDVLRQINQLTKDQPVKVSITDDAVISKASPINTRLFAAIEAANRRFHADPKTKPPVKTPILNSTTDAAYFRQRGMIVYGFEPIMLDPDDEHSHGDDEQISVSAMRFATHVTEFYLKDFLSSTPPVDGGGSKVRR